MSAPHIVVEFVERERAIGFEIRNEPIARGLSHLFAGQRQSAEDVEITIRVKDAETGEEITHHGNPEPYGEWGSALESLPPSRKTHYVELLVQGGPSRKQREEGDEFGSTIFHTSSEDGNPTSILPPGKRVLIEVKVDYLDKAPVFRCLVDVGDGHKRTSLSRSR